MFPGTSNRMGEEQPRRPIGAAFALAAPLRHESSPSRRSSCSQPSPFFSLWDKSRSYLGAQWRNATTSLRASSTSNSLTNCHTKLTATSTSGAPVLRTAVLVSGGGRSLQNICERVECGLLTGIQLGVVIASKVTAGGIARGQRFGLKTRVVCPRDFDRESNDFSQAVTAVLDEFRIDLVVLAGWMHFYSIPDHYQGRVINIHPSLIPSFCGKGYYGSRVHQAVLDFGAKVTGCTVHMADNEYDHGPIILQRAVPVLEDDDVDTLAARVFEAEKDALPEAIQLFADGRLQIQDQRLKVLPVRSQGPDLA